MTMPPEIFVLVLTVLVRRSGNSKSQQETAHCQDAVDRKNFDFSASFKGRPESLRSV